MAESCLKHDCCSDPQGVLPSLLADIGKKAWTHVATVSSNRLKIGLPKPNDKMFVAISSNFFIASQISKRRKKNYH